MVEHFIDYFDVKKYLYYLLLHADTIDAYKWKTGPKFEDLLNFV